MPTPAHATRPAHAPYAEDWVDAIYDMLFCDRPQAFAPHAGAAPAPWQAALCGAQPDLRAAAALAADRGAEAQVRLLACHLLRAHGLPVPGCELLGVVVEVALDGGLDTLAAYVDGSVRYLGRNGQVEMLDALPQTLPIVRRLAEASAAVVSRIGRWRLPRNPAPPRGHVRLSFLATDGLYFGEGSLPVLQRDALAGPVIEHATALLHAVTGLTVRRAA